MVGAPIDITYKFSSEGTDQVKSDLDQLSDAFNRAKASGGQFGKEQRALSSAVSRRIGEDRLQNRLLLAQHPSLLKASRIMSTLSSITRGLLTVQNALNLAKLNSNTIDIEGEASERRVNELTREMNNELKKLHPNMQKVADIQEQINIELATNAERIQALKDSKFSEWFTMLTSIVFTASTVFGIFRKDLSTFAKVFTTIGGAIASAGGALAILGTAVTAFFAIPALVSALPLFASRFLDLIPGMKELQKSFGEWMRSLGTLDATWLDEAVPKFFNEDIPLAVGNAGIALSQFFLTDLPLWSGIGLELLKTAFITTFNGIISAINFGVNSVISGINLIINGAISAINSFISAINRILTRARLGTIPLIPSFSGIPTVNLPLIAAAKGFNGMVNSPTMFLAGEAGPEQVSITPNSGRSGSGNTIIINVGGSVVTERKLAQIVDQYQKQNLKSRGFTGFG